MPFNCSKTKRAANHQDLRLKGSIGYSIFTSTSRLHDLHQTKSFPSLYLAISFPQLHFIGLSNSPLPLYNIFFVCQCPLFMRFSCYLPSTACIRLRVQLRLVGACVYLLCLLHQARLNERPIRNISPDVSGFIVCSVRN